MQVKSAGGKLHIGHEMGEVANPTTGTTPIPDGLVLTDTNTGFAAASTAPPFTTWWKGELWYSAEVAGQALCLVILGEADEPREEADKYGTASSKELDTLNYDGYPTGVVNAGKRR
jgi:hypothetical protein